MKNTDGYFWWNLIVGAILLQVIVFAGFGVESMYASIGIGAFWGVIVSMWESLRKGY